MRLEYKTNILTIYIQFFRYHGESFQPVKISF